MKEKLKKLKEIIKEHNKDSRNYLDEFYTQCKDCEVDDLDWIECDDDYMDFIGQQPVEYNRIYDIAVLYITNQLMEIINDKN
tara:strand:- start:1043 stop:1288 length:246 start_codon:yes stop_codon:yes gene_type:complete